MENTCGVETIHLEVSPGGVVSSIASGSTLQTIETIHTEVSGLSVSRDNPPMEHTYGVETIHLEVSPTGVVSSMVSGSTSQTIETIHTEVSGLNVSWDTKRKPQGLHSRRKQWPHRNRSTRFHRECLGQVIHCMLGPTTQMAPNPLLVLSTSQLASLVPIAYKVSLASVTRVSRRSASKKFTWTISSTGPNITQRHFVILADTASILGNLQGIVTICHSKERSPFALLAAVTHSPHMFSGDTIYGHDTVHELELVKPNLCKNIQSWHHDSRGGVYGFGTKASYSYDPKLKSSVDAYCLKQSTKYSHSKHALGHHHQLHHTLIGTIECAQTAINKQLFVGNAVRMGCTLIEAAVKAAHTSNSKLTKTLGFQGKTKFTSVFYNINAETLSCHNEQDASYTLLGVPMQRRDDIQHSPIYFEFHLNPNKVLPADMETGSCIYFSGFFLTHRQVLNPNFDASQRKWINVSAYGNRRLLSNTLTTMRRNLED